MPPTAKGKTRQAARANERGVLDRPKGIEERLAEGRAERESVPLEAHGERRMTVRTRSASSRSRARRVCPSSCRSGTGG